MSIKPPNGSVFVIVPRIQRLSIHPGDRGHKAYMDLGERRFDVKVLLNGAEVRHCLVADAKAGYVDCVVHRDGQPVLNRFRDGFVIHRTHGEVVIKCPPAH